MHTTYRVTAKAILLNEEMTKVLVAHYSSGSLGLPGGHIDADETPDQAVRRELEEEIGVSGLALRHFDFDRHHDGRIVLFFAGVIDEDTPLVTDPNELVSADWIELDKISSGEVSTGFYAKFILEAPGFLRSSLEQ